MQKKQERIFRDMGVWKAIAALAVPAMITMIVMIFYNMADMFFVGQMGDTAQVAAVSLAGPAFTMMMAVGTLLGGGGCVLIAKTLGQGDEEKVKLYSSLCCFWSIAFGVIYMVVVFIFTTPILHFLGANEEIWDYAKMYLRVLALGAPVMIFTTGFGSVIRAEGAVKEGMIGNLFSTITNIILDPVFILVLKLGVGGAAIATVLGNVVGALYFVFYMKRGKTSFTLNPAYAIKNPWEVRKILVIGIPNAMSSVLVGFASAFANQLLVKHGTNAVAAMAAAGKSTMIISMVQMGICLGVQPMLAYCCGDGNMPRIRETLRKLSLLTVLVGSAATLFCVLNSRAVIALFLKNQEALSLGQEMVMLLMITGPFLGIYYISTNFLQASGNAGLAAIISMLRQGFFLVPLLAVMNYFWGVKGITLAHVTADLTAVVTAGLLALHKYRILKSSLEDDICCDIEAKKVDI